MPSTLRFLARALARPQLETATVTGPVVVGEKWSVTINGKTVSFTAATTVVADVVAGLVAALNDSTIPEFAEVTWEADSPDVLGTGPDDDSFTMTVSTDSAGGGFSTTTTTSYTGPDNYADVINWSTGSLPVTGDTVVLDVEGTWIRNGFAQSGVTLAAIYTSGVDIKIGRPRVNANGYTDYRPLALSTGCTLTRIGGGDGPGSSLIRINYGSVQNTTEVQKLGNSVEEGVPAACFVGTHASNVFDVNAKYVGLGYFADEVATALTLSVSEAGGVLCGPGVTLGTVVSNGEATIRSATGTALKVYGGTTRVYGSGTHALVDVYGGVCKYMSAGTASAVKVGPGQVDCADDNSARTFTATTLRAGGTINDPNHTVTHGSITPDVNVKQLTAA